MAVLLTAIAFGGFQLLPFPNSVLQRIAPQNAALWEQLTPTTEPTAAVTLHADSADWSQRTAWPISLNPTSTKHDLALLSLAAGIFLVGAFQFRSNQAVCSFLFAVALCGAALAFFGIAQQITWSGKIYGIVELTQGGSPFAAFVNRNNAGGFLNLCLAACLGLLVWSMSPNDRRTDASGPAGGRSSRSSPKFSVQNPWREMVANITGVQVLALLASVLVLGAVFCTLSRGAMLACVLALAILAMASRTIGRNRSLKMVGWTVIVLGGVGLTAWVGRFDEIQQRAASITGSQQPDGRWSHWNDALSVAAHFWPAGSGLGTHRFIYKLYEESPIDAWFFHAENQYVEALVDGGWLGLALLATAIALTVAASWQLLRNGTNSMDRALGVMGLFAISSQAIHAFFDFGLYLPANMCLLALISGIVHGRYACRLATGLSPAGTASVEKMSPSSVGLLVGQPGRLSMATALCALLVVAVVNLLGEAQADAAVRSLPAESVESSKPGSNWQHVRAWEAACLKNAKNAEARLGAAEAWIERYRFAAWEAAVKRRPGDNPDLLWSLTAPAEVHTFVRTLEQSRRSVELEDFRNSRIVRDNLVPAVRHLYAARAACPLLPEIHLLLSELEPIISSSAIAGSGIERVGICAPRNSQRLSEAGLVAMVASNPKAAAALWRQAATVNPQRLPILLRIAAAQPVMHDHLAEMLPRDLDLLIHTARESLTADEDRELRQLVVTTAKEILPDADLEDPDFEDAERLHAEGMLLLLENQRSEAVKKLTSASYLKPLVVAWRYDLATALAEQGKIEEARDHASFCLRMEPENERYKALLKTLIRNALTAQ